MDVAHEQVNLYVGLQEIFDGIGVYLDLKLIFFVSKVVYNFEI